MRNVGFALLALVSITTLMAMAVGVPPEQFTGPECLRNSIAGRIVLLAAGFLGFVILSFVLDLVNEGLRCLL